MEIGIIALIVFVSLFAIWLIFYFIPVGLWFSALVSGVRISLLQLILMRWRKVPPSTIEARFCGCNGRNRIERNYFGCRYNRRCAVESWLSIGLYGEQYANRTTG